MELRSTTKPPAKLDNVHHDISVTGTNAGGSFTYYWRIMEASWPQYNPTGYWMANGWPGNLYYTGYISGQALTRSTMTFSGTSYSHWSGTTWFFVYPGGSYYDTMISNNSWQSGWYRVY